MRLPAAALLSLCVPALADTEVERTWAGAHFAWSGQGRAETGDLAEAGRALGADRAPAVVYLHGCAGFDRAAAETADFLGRAGFFVAAPDSFRRTTKPPSCKAGATDLHRGALGWRQAEAAYAVEQVRRLPFVDPDRIYLYGFSEGGAAAATLVGPAVRARVIEGWGCRSGWPEYEGLRAPPGEPVLSLTAAGRGDCGAYMKNRFGSRSVVFRAPDPLSRAHRVSGDPAVRRMILEFLRSR